MIYIFICVHVALWCIPTSVPFSDHSVLGSVTGFFNDTVEVMCIDGYSGGGKNLKYYILSHFLAAFLRSYR